MKKYESDGVGWPTVEPVAGFLGRPAEVSIVKLNGRAHRVLRFAPDEEELIRLLDGEPEPAEPERMTRENFLARAASAADDCSKRRLKKVLGIAQELRYAVSDPELQRVFATIIVATLIMIALRGRKAGYTKRQLARGFGGLNKEVFHSALSHLVMATAISVTPVRRAKVVTAQTAEE